MRAILGKKLGMTQIFEGDEVVPVTVIKAGPCVVVQRKEKKKDGYDAVQLGFEKVKEKSLTKPELGHLKKHGADPVRYLKEIRLDGGDLSIYNKKEIKVGIFKKGDKIRVTSISKGKGFAGVMKRHGFGGGPASHGASQWHRRPGSIGASSDPSRVFKGKKMPGRMGKDKVTIRNLEVAGVDEEEDLLLVKGSVPGKNGALVIIKEEKR